MCTISHRQALRLDCGDNIVIILGYNTTAAWIMVDGTPLGHVVKLSISVDPADHHTERYILLRPEAVQTHQDIVTRLARAGFDVYLDMFRGQPVLAVGAMAHDDAALALAQKENAA